MREVRTDKSDMPGLVLSEQVARASLVQVRALIAKPAPGLSSAAGSPAAGGLPRGERLIGVAQQ